MSHEFPTADPEMWLEIMAKPLRYRQLSIWDWQLPKDDSLEVYRQNLKALKAKQGPPPCKYGHTGGRYRRPDRPSGWGDCIECRQIKDVARYRLAAGIPLDVPIMDTHERSRYGARNRTTCPHGPDTERTAYGHCKACKRDAEAARREKVAALRADEQTAFELWDRRRDNQRWHQRDRMSA